MAEVVDALGLVGATIDQVRFDACVDSGGFGLVYRGRHTGLDEDVAIKCLRIASAQTLDAELKDAIAARFRDETKLLYRLSQGNLDIVRCIGGGLINAPKTNELTPYMILEWLDGKTLAVDLRERRDARVGGRSLTEVLVLLESAANALAYAHAQDVVHRDVKPGNLYLARTREGGQRVKVLDFGLAKILDDESLGVRPTAMTQQGVHFCSPSYGAPEQYSHGRGPVGPWTDVYAFALVVLELLTGQKARPASSLAEGVVKALDPETGSPTASRLGLRLPRDVEAVLARAVAQDTSARPRDLGAFWAELRRAFDGAARATNLATTAPDTTRDDARAQVATAQQQLLGARTEPTSPPLGPMGGPRPPLAGTLVMGDTSAAQAQAQAALARAQARQAARGANAPQAPGHVTSPPGLAQGHPPRAAPQAPLAGPHGPRGPSGPHAPQAPAAAPHALPRESRPHPNAQVPTRTSAPTSAPAAGGAGTSTGLVVLFVVALLVALAGAAVFVARFVLHR